MSPTHSTANTKNKKKKVKEHSRRMYFHFHDPGTGYGRNPKAGRLVNKPDGSFINNNTKPFFFGCHKINK